MLDAEQRRRVSDDPESLEEEANKRHRAKEINGVMHEELLDAQGQMERAQNQRAAKMATDKRHRELVEEQVLKPSRLFSALYPWRVARCVSLARRSSRVEM